MSKNHPAATGLHHEARHLGSKLKTTKVQAPMPKNLNGPEARVYGTPIPASVTRSSKSL